jgi:hypothetical protein
MGRRSPAELYLWVWGAALVFLGVGSLVVHPDFAVGHGVTGARFLGVETNGWHGVAGLAAGILALAYARSRRWAPTVAMVVGVVAGLVPGVVFVISGDRSVALGLIPVDMVDAVALHLVPGVIGALCALATARPLRRGAVAAAH